MIMEFRAEKILVFYSNSLILQVANLRPRDIKYHLVTDLN